MSKSVRNKHSGPGFRVDLAQLPRSHPFSVRRLKRQYGVGMFSADDKAARTRI
jgi:hypothetical protein